MSNRLKVFNKLDCSLESNTHSCIASNSSENVLGLATDIAFPGNVFLAPTQTVNSFALEKGKSLYSIS